MPLFEVPSRFPGPLSVVTVHADPVARVIEVVPIESFSPRFQLGWFRFVWLSPARSATTVARGTRPHRWF